MAVVVVQPSGATRENSGPLKLPQQRTERVFHKDVFSGAIAPPIQGKSHKRTVIIQLFVMKP